MATKTIEQFFTGKSLQIPPYQRDYAWNTDNVDDLFDDILEAMEMGGGHYLGTFILSASDTKERFKVVDGQQRLTTLTILLDALIDALSDGELKTYYRSIFLRNPIEGQKFTVLGENQSFFIALLDDTNPQPVSAGQRRLWKAYDWIRQRVQEIKKEGGDKAIQDWLVNISKLEVLEFIEPNEGKAIRMFQSVNDRGVPLSKMDIAKSLLIYHSNRFLGGDLDDLISKQFGTAFFDYSRIKSLAAEDGYEIRLINREAFCEDDVFRYHYFAYDADRYNGIPASDPKATTELVLEKFLKPTLKQLRSDPVALKSFIQDYVSDLAGFFSAFRALVEAVRTDKALYLLFVVGDLAATLYPLLTRLAMRNLLREPISKMDDFTPLQMIEVIDLRVFKLRGTNPQVDILRLAREAAKKSLINIALSLRDFVYKFMDDMLFEARLIKEDLYHNPGVVRILIAMEEKQRIALGKPGLSVTDLVTLVKAGQTVEHILSQEPSFEIHPYGFSFEQQYKNHIDRLGNLTLLEKRLNSACNNQAVETKMSDKRFYKASSYQMTRALAASNAELTPAFSLGNISSRGVELAELCVKEWPLW